MKILINLVLSEFYFKWDKQICRIQRKIGSDARGTNETTKNYELRSCFVMKIEKRTLFSCSCVHSELSNDTIRKYRIIYPKSSLIS